MIAATSSKGDRVLETLKLVLMMASNKEKYSDTLKDYFFNTFTNAKSLLNNPTTFDDDLSPDVISLALRLKVNEELLELLEQMHQEQKISKEPAFEALNQLESVFDPSREPAHFSQEICASI